MVMRPDIINSYDYLRKQAEEIFWKKFEELRTRFPDINMKALRDIAAEMFDEYMKFTTSKKFHNDRYKAGDPAEGDRQTHWNRIFETEHCLQGAMAFGYTRLARSEPFTISAIAPSKDYFYRAAAEDCLNLGPQTADVVFGAIVSRIIDSVKPIFGTHIKVDRTIPSFVKGKKELSKLVSVKLSDGLSMAR